MLCRTDVVPSVSSVNTAHISDVYNEWTERQMGRELFSLNIGWCMYISKDLIQDIFSQVVEYHEGTFSHSLCY